MLNIDNLTIPIQKVSLQWVKTPIYDPLLDIFVERSFTIPSSQTRQTYGVSITGKLSEPQPSFFSSPKKMTPYEILASLLTHQKANVLNTKQSRDVLSLLGNQNLSEDEIIKMSRTLSAIKRMFIFDYIDYQSQELGSDSAFFRDAEIQLTRRLNKDLTLQLQLNSQKPGSGKVLLEKKINDNVSLNTYIDGSGRGGVACHITR